MRTCLILVLTLWTGVAVCQSYPPEILVLFDALTVEEDRIQLTPDQSLAVRRIARQAKRGRLNRALAGWEQFVVSTYVGGDTIDYDRVALLIVRDGYFSFRDVRSVADRYTFYRRIGFSLIELSDQVADYAQVADPNDQVALSELETRIIELAAQQSRLNSDLDTILMNLQLLMQERNQALQAGSALLASLNESRQAIVQSLR